MDPSFHVEDKPWPEHGCAEWVFARLISVSGWFAFKTLHGASRKKKACLCRSRTPEKRAHIPRRRLTTFRKAMKTLMCCTKVSLDTTDFEMHVKDWIVIRKAMPTRSASAMQNLTADREQECD